MIEVQKLTKHYGPVTAIRDVSFNVGPGEIVGFLGPNGAGKSTTMRILAEPTVGLDPKQITEIRALIKSFAGRHTVILSTHILPEVSMVCGGVVIINKGSIVAQGPIDTLVDQFFPTSRVEVEIVGPAAAVQDGMRRIDGVVSVQELATTNGAGRYLVESGRGRDVRGEIFQLAAQPRRGLLELRRVGTTLEEVFIRVVAGEQAGEEAAP